MIRVFGYLVWRSAYNRLARQIRHLRSPRYVAALVVRRGVSLVHGDRPATGRQWRHDRRQQVGRAGRSHSVTGYGGMGLDLRGGAAGASVYAGRGDLPVLCSCLPKRAHPVQAASQPAVHPLQCAALDPDPLEGTFRHFPVAPRDLDLGAPHHTSRSIVSVLRSCGRALPSTAGWVFGTGWCRWWCWAWSWWHSHGPLVMHCPASPNVPSEDPFAFLPALGEAAAQPIPAALTFPFRLMVRPLVANDFGEWIRALWPAVVLMLLHYVWVVRSDTAFEESAAAVSLQRAQALAERKAGRGPPIHTPVRVTPPLIRLAPTGWPAGAILWKNLVAVARTRQLHKVGLGLVLGGAIVTALSFQPNAMMAAIAGWFAITWAGAMIRHRAAVGAERSARRSAEAGSSEELSAAEAGPWSPPKWRRRHWY